MWSASYYAVVFCWTTVLWLLVPTSLLKGCIAQARACDVAAVSGALGYGLLSYYYLEQIKFSRGAAVNQPLPNVHHLTMGVCIGALLSFCAVLVARMDTSGRWPATVLLAPTYVVLLSQKIAVPFKSIQVSQGAARQWLVHGLWLGSASVPPVLTFYWGSTLLWHFLGRFVKSGDLPEERRPLGESWFSSSKSSGRYAAVELTRSSNRSGDSDAADDAVDEGGESGVAGASASTSSSYSSAWSLLLMLLMLFYDCWLAVFPARVETVSASGIHTQYNTFFGLDLEATVDCAATHTLSSAAEWTLSGPPSSAAPWDVNKPNVLWVLHDDLRAIWSRPYAEHHTLTPRIDTLANESFVFNQAYCQIGVCAPSRASLLTGRRPDAIHSYSFDVNFRAEWHGVTLPQLFKQNGYLTSGTGKIYHQGVPAMGDPLSWSCEYAYLDHGQQKCGTSRVASNSDMATLLRGHAIETSRFCSADDTVFVDEEATQRTLHAIDQAVRLRRPFFAATGLRGMHGAYGAPKDTLERYFETWGKSVPFDESNFWSKGVPPAFPLDAPGLADNHDHWMSMENHTNYNLTAIWRLYYRATVTFADDMVGRLLDKLEEHDLSKSTVVVLSADHGVHLGEQSLSSKNTNFEAATRVPLLFRAPMLMELGSMRRIGGLAENVDIYPTLAELAGLTTADNSTLGGTSLVAAMESQTAKAYALSQYMRCTTNGNWKCTHSFNEDITQMGYSIRVSGWRYTEWLNWNQSSAEADWKSTVAVELYRYEDDGGDAINDYSNNEAVNLAASSSSATEMEKVSELASELRARHGVLIS